MTDNRPEYSVSELAGALKRTVEDAFGLVRVRGEISGLKIAASGHAYLALKDANAVLDGVMWKGGVRALRFRPEDGLEVVATGKLTTYPGRSKYQIVIEQMEPAGAGALMALLEARKVKLAAEGLFAAERKQALPYLPRVIGVVTSPTGAVIRDILHRLSDRFPRHVLVWPVQVQGEAAAGQIAAAIAGFDAMPETGPVPRPDLLIVARGGGSIEDLWAFNEEVVVRAAAACRIPLISAVGHETDTTLIDFVSDRRAPTPTAAAEQAVPVRADLQFTVGDLGLRLGRAMTRNHRLRAERVEAVAKRLPSPRLLLGQKQQRFDELAERLPRALVANIEIWRGRLAKQGGALRPALLQRCLDRSREGLARAGIGLDNAAGRRVVQLTHALDRAGAGLRPMLLRNRAERDAARLAQASRLLDSLNPLAILGRGYAVVEQRTGGLVTSAQEARVAQGLTLRFADDRVNVIVEDAGVMKPARGPKPSRDASKDQGKLF